MRKLFFVITLTVFIFFSVRPSFGQKANVQSRCEQKLLHDSQAEEITKGPEYDIFLEVSEAFGRKQPPRLYFVPGGGSAAYIAGSVGDSRGKILMSRTFVELMGNTPALKGIMAHETAHLVLDIPGITSCDQWIYRDLKSEESADTLAVSKVGVVPVRAFLLRIRDLVGVTRSEVIDRLEALDKLEALQKSRQ